MPREKIEKNFKEIADKIFISENVGAISYFISNLIPKQGSLVKEDSFKTVVNAAEYDGMRKLLDIIVEASNK